MKDLRKLTIVQMAKGLRNRDFSVAELVKAHVDAEDKFNAFVTKTHESAMAKAEYLDRCFASDEAQDLHALSGIPVGVKDLFCTKGVKTTSCSKMLSSFIPSYESTVSQSLADCGAVMIGKTNMDEFAMGSANINSYYGYVTNPWSSSVGKTLVPGGSSGGSAAAVSGFLCAGALGSDTGGSIRQPASFCGIVGVKPTYGRCSRYGMISFSSSLDQAGVFARSVEDAYIMLSSIMNHDPKDSTSSTFTENDKSTVLEDVDLKKIGFLSNDFLSDMSDDVLISMKKCLSWFGESGVELHEVDMPYMSYALPVYYVISSAESSSNLSRYDGVRYGFRADAENLHDMYFKTRSIGFGDEVKRRILLGTYVLSAGSYDSYYLKARSVRSLIAKDFENAFESGLDCLIFPTTPTSPFAIDEKIGKVAMYYNDFFTVPASLAGLPVVSVPIALGADGLPISIQVIGKKNSEKKIMSIAKFIENIAGTFTPKDC